jgi:hypothetical protein
MEAVSLTAVEVTSEPNAVANERIAVANRRLDSWRGNDGGIHPDAFSSILASLDADDIDELSKLGFEPEDLALFLLEPEGAK